MDGVVHAPSEATRHLIPLVERAAQAWRVGSKAIAERLCLDVLELAPDRVGALTVLYEIRKAEGNQRATTVLVRRIVTLDPNNFWATNELTLLLLASRNLQEALVHARNAVRIAPENAQSHNLLGMAMTEAQQAPVGEYHYRRALELANGRDPVLLANLAWSLKCQGRVEEARALYTESVAAHPDVPQTLLGWAHLEEADRKLDAAHAKLDALEKIDPKNVGSRLARATVLGRQKRYEEALALLENAPGETQHLGPSELQDKGRLLDSMGRYDDAWAAFEAGKAAVRQGGGGAYLEAQAAAMAARLRGFFTAKRLALLPRAGTRQDVAQPIFILGFPRSGTTLLEQTLSAAPHIVAGDELPLINDITHLMSRMLNSPLGYPEALVELWMGDQREGLDNLRDYYLQKVRQIGVLRDGATLFTDKMPLNETHLGLIALLFPGAPLIHMIRHPLDVMVSAMSNHFTHGLLCATALETAARHYVLIADLVQHYRAEMSLRYLPVRYEDMVDEQEATVRSVFDFIGEPFDPAVLQFEKNARYARTASYAQVTEKLYDRSRYRYRHYLKHLGPAIEILQPVIARLGYTVE
jgi:tetratricopeptide (TPR) repeat protein